MSAKVIIALHGIANCGKSSVIKEIDKIIQQTYSIAVNEHAGQKFQDSNDTGDIFKIYELIHNKKKLQIGIESQGDPNSRIFKSLPIFKKINCDIIICATRSSGKTCDAVVDTGYEIFWVQQNYIVTDNIKTDISDSLLTDLIHKKQDKMIELVKYIFDNIVDKLTK